MNRRSLLAAGAAMAVLPATNAFALVNMTSAEVALINQISAYNSTIKSMAGKFLQVDTQGQRISGTFYLVRPNQIRFRYDPPSRQEIISVGRGFYVIDRKEHTAYAYPQDKVPLRQFLNDKIDLLGSDLTDVTESPTYLTVGLSDDTPAGPVAVQLVFDIATKDLAQWTLTEPSGLETTFSLYDVQKNVDIPKSYFYIDPTYKSPISQ
jgi:outer membrane lipoprotein-sorting protein